MRLSVFVWYHRKAVILLTLILCVAGLYFSQNLPVAIFPDLTAPRIIVTADSGDTPIPAMLANVTRPLESAVAGVPRISRIHSLTERGSAELDVNFNWGTDMRSTLQLLQANLAQIQSTLPPGTQLQASLMNPSVFPVMGYSLYANDVDPQELRRITQYVLRPRLLRVDGVQQIDVMGGDRPAYLVNLDPNKMLADGVSLQNVEDALEKTNQISSVGYYDESFLHNEVMVSGLLKGPDDIAAVTVVVKNRVPITIGQLGVVRPGVEPRTIETSGDGHDAVLIDVIKQPSANAVKVAEGIKAALDAARPELPAGLTVSNFYDQSEIVRESQSSVIEAIIVGGLLSLIVLMLFLGNLRTALMVLIILPLTILITFGLMKLIGQTLNIMTLGALAIALGLVIDDGIVVIENIFQELEVRSREMKYRTSGAPSFLQLRRSADDLNAAPNSEKVESREVELGLGTDIRRAAIGAGLRSITPAMVGSSLTTMAAFLPLSMLSGLTGQFFAPLAIVMVATLAVSLVLALLLTPILADYMLPRTLEEHHGPFARAMGVFPRFFDRMALAYARVLRACLNRWVFVLLLLIPIVAVAWVAFGKLETGFFPEFDEGGFILDYQMPYGTSLAETGNACRRIEAILARTPEVAAWSRRTGAQLGFDITTQDSGDMSVRLKSDRTRTVDQIMDDVRDQVQQAVPVAQVDFHQILQDNIGDIAGSPNPVEVKIFGDDETVLEHLARQVDDIVSHTKGVVDDANGIILSSPETVLTVDTAAAERYGLDADDVRQSAQAAVGGVVPTAVQQGEQAIDVRVHIEPPDQVLSRRTLSMVPIYSPVTQSNVPLGDIVQIDRSPGVLNVTRENQREMIAVTAGIADRDLGSVTRDIQRSIGSRVQLPPGYSIEYGGLYESQQQSFHDLAVVLVTAVLLVFLLLVVQLRSLRQSASLLIAAILSLSGVVLGLFVTKTPLNISSMTGAVMIVGIVTENGIVLFDFYNVLRRHNPARSIVDTMADACVKRLRPIMMTTLGAILALFPLALGIGAGAALQKPLAIAVIGGLTVSTLFTLVFAPVLFTSLERLKPSRRVEEAESDFAQVEQELACND